MYDFLINYTFLFISEIWSLCIETAPFLLMGMFFSGFIYVFVDSKFIFKHIGKKNISSIFKSTLVGIPIPLCSCGVIPVAATLRDSGASKGSTVSFLVSTPQTGIDSIFLTYGMLGPIFALFRPIAAFVSGIFSGLVINNFDDESHHHTSNSNNINETKETLITRLKMGLKYGFITLPSDIIVPLIQGLSIAAIIAISIPPDFIAQYFSFNPYFVFIFMLFISLPIYVCATASIPIAVALMAKGVSAGAVFVFLMAGPATNASSIAVIKNILGKKIMYLYLALISFTAIFFGIMLDYFTTIQLPLHSNHSHIHDEINFMSIFLTILFVLVLINAYIHRFKKNSQIIEKVDNKINSIKDDLSILVGGMTCSHCTESIKNTLENLDEVDSTNINLQTGQVVIKGTKLNEEMIKSKIKSLGFFIK